MTPRSPGDKEPWHLDRKVPITLIVALLIQTGGFVWWAAKQDTRLTHLEEKLAEQKDDPVRLARLEGFKDDLTKCLDRFELKLDRLVEHNTQK